jgi:hypothetical protein
MKTLTTPGPWQLYADLPSTDPNWHIITSESRMRVLANVHIEPGNAMDAANARLMTESPAMYSAIVNVLAHADMCSAKGISQNLSEALYAELAAIIEKVQA